MTKSDRVVCSNHCEDQLANVEDALKTLRRNTEKGYKWTGIYTISLGIIFLILATIVFIHANNKAEAFFPALMGTVFIVFGIILLRIFKKKKAN